MKPAPASPPDGVAAEQHPIRVGDVILAPPVEAQEDDAHVIRRPSAERHAEAAPPKRWYGLPIVVTDGVAYALLATAITNEKISGVVLPLSLPAYALGGPITHAANGHWGRAGISVLLRAGLPLTGALLGASGCGRGSGDCTSGVVSTVIVGMAIATLIDAAALSWETTAPRRASSLQPSLGLSHEAGWVGASGCF